MWLIRIAFALGIAACGALWSGADTCLTLSPGQTLQVRDPSSAGSVCVVLDVLSGEAAQVTVNQTADLAFRVTGGNTQTTADGFEFGVETLTFLAGHYRIDIAPAVLASPVKGAFSIARRALPLQSASPWRDAETSATLSKQTAKLEDIAVSLRRWKGLNDNSAIARTWLKQGDALLAAHDLPAARDAYEQAFALCDSLRDLRCTAEAANNSGYMSFLLGNLEAAAPRLRQAAGDFEQLSMRLLEGRALNNLGMMFRQSGNFDDAIQTLDKARLILRRRDVITYAQVLNNLGLCYQSLAGNEKALAYFQSALSIFLASHEHAVRARYNLGRCYMLLGNLRRAKTHLELALDEAVTTGNDPARADVLNNLGQLLLKLNRRDDARAKLTAALNLQRLVHSKRGEATALHYLGVDASQRGDAAGARQLLTGASRLRQDAGLRDEASDSVFALAALEYHEGNLAAARDLATQAAGLIESLRTRVPTPALRATYYARKRALFDLLIDLAMNPAQPADPVEGFLASEQAHGRALLDLLTAGEIAGTVPSNLLTRRTNLRRQIDFLSQRLVEADPQRQSEAARRLWERSREDWRRQIQLLLSEDEQVEAEIRKAVHTSALGQPLSSVAALRAALPPATALLEFYLGEHESFLWVVQPAGILSFRLPARAVLEPLASRAADRFSAILERRRSPQAEAAFEADLRRLSNILLGPLTGLRLPPRLVLVLDGALNRVPMAALRTPRSREPLGLSFDLIRAPSAAYLLAAKPPPPVSSFPRSVLVVADPVFGASDPRVSAALPPAAAGDSLPRLPFAGEVKVLAAILPESRMRLLKGFDAAPARLHELELADFAVVHFSTHAFIDGRIPELSRIALSLVDRSGRPVNGYLRPREFADFRLKGSIVVLSSCETALGKEVLGEGLAGFSSGLLSAGASQMVIALTKVDAESSAAFFAETYRRFFGAHPMSMERSLTEARRVLAHSTRWSDPYYWAPFIVTGAPSR